MLFSKKKGRLQQKWDYHTHSQLLCGPLAYDLNKDGKKEIIVGTKDGKVILLDDNSEVMWTYNVQEDIGDVESFFHDEEKSNAIHAAPLIADIDKDGQNEVIFATEAGNVYCLDSHGIVRWKTKLPSAVRAGIHLYDVNDDDMQELILGCMDGNLYVISAVGQIIWDFYAHNAVESTPMVIPNTKKILFGCHDGTLRCVEYKNKELWSFPTQGKIVAQPIVSDLLYDNRNFIAVGSTDYYMYLLDEQGQLVWKYRTNGAILSKAASADINKDGKKELVFGSCDNNVYALTHEGDELWSYETYFWVAAAPIIEDVDDDGKMEVVVGSYDHNIYVLDSEGYYELDYVPGLGGVINQPGHYAEMMTMQPGHLEAKKIWQYKMPGLVVGCDASKKSIIVNVKEGRVSNLVHVAKN
ncbi:PQQ-binding-like beta-propeller repeat protein [Nanoarchaeota archaeon]